MAPNHRRPTARRHTSASPGGLYVGAAIIIAILAGGAYWLTQHKNERTISGTANLDAMRAYTDEVLQAWKIGKDHPRAIAGRIFNVNSWTITDARTSKNKARIAVIASVESANKGGEAIRINWTFAWVNLAKGWTLCGVTSADEAGDIEAWTWK